MAVFVHKIETAAPEPEVELQLRAVPNMGCIGLWANCGKETHLLAFFSDEGHMVLCNGNPDLPGLSMDGQGTLNVDYYERGDG